MGLRRGDPAPEFDLPGTDAGEHGRYDLSDFRGSPVLLVFYPADRTPVCTKQLNTYTRDISRFADLDAAVLAISPQGLGSHDDFADEQGGFAFPLLADESKVVGRLYGVVGPLGFYRRSVFVVDAGGRVAWLHRSMGNLQFQPTDDLVAALTD